jgi:hypothetical protein
LVARSVVTRLGDVRAVDVDRQRHHGSAGGEREGDGPENDELSHDGLLCPLLRRAIVGVVEYPTRAFVGINSLRVVSNNVTMGALAEIEREAVHTAATLFLAVWNRRSCVAPRTALPCCIGPLKRCAPRALDRVRPPGRLYTTRPW